MSASLIDVTRLKIRSDIPAHRQVAAYFKAIIALKEMSPGDSLPGVTALAGRIGAPAAEVRQAYAELEKRGFATSEGGKWRVSEDRAAASDEIGDRLGEIIADARRAGLTRAEIERLFESLISRP
jgi:DNA-binding transcriptional regulator YhcF (GntR family)